MALLSQLKHSFGSFHLPKKAQLLPSDGRKIFDTFTRKLIHALPRHRLQGLAWLGVSLLSGIAALHITSENADSDWYRMHRPSAQIWKSSFENFGFVESKNAREAQALSRALPSRSALNNTVWYRDDGLVWVVIESESESGESDSSMLPRVFLYERALKNKGLMKKYGSGTKGWILVEGSGWKAFTPAFVKVEAAAKKWNELIAIYGKSAAKPEIHDSRAISY